MADLKDVTSASSPELKAALEGSAPLTEPQTQEAQALTAEQGVTQEQEMQQTEEERIPYSRFKDVNDEKNWYKQQLEQQLQQRQQFQQPILQPQPQDPYANMNPDEKVFWQNVDTRAEQKARQLIEREIRPIIEAGRQEIARMSVAQFRQRYSDVKPNSPEEIEIAQRIQAGYLPDDAYKVVMWDKKLSETESKTRQNTQQRTQQKRQANVETSGLSQSSQSLPKETFEEEIRRRMAEE